MQLFQIFFIFIFSLLSILQPSFHYIFKMEVEDVLTKHKKGAWHRQKPLSRPARPQLKKHGLNFNSLKTIG